MTHMKQKHKEATRGRWKESEETIRSLLAECNSQDRSIKMFCQTRGLPEWRFYSWKRKYSASRPPSGGPAGFVALQVHKKEAPLTSTRAIFAEVQSAKGIRIRFFQPVDVSYLQSLHAYAAYLAAFKDHPHIILLCCLAHTRRKFEHALTNDTHRATHVLEVIKKLYDLERKAREASYSHEQICQLRQQQALPLLDQLKKWLDTNVAATLKNSPIGEAIRYALNIWDRLLVYTTDGRLLPDTNLVENAIRPTKIGLKNYLFQGNEQGAKRAAVLYSLLETCKKNDIDPYEWLKDVYTRIPTHPINRIRELLPTFWKQLHQTATNPS